MSGLKQYFYVYDLFDVDGTIHTITERATFFEDWKPDKIEMPNCRWRGWLDELVMQGKHPF